MTLGNRIYALRTKSGLSQEELAERLGVSRQSVSKWETDASIPELDKLIQLAKVFGITLDALVQDESEEAEAKSEPAEPTSPRAEASASVSTNRGEGNPSNRPPHTFLNPAKIVGFILIAAALLGIFFSLIFPMGYTEQVLILSVYCALCGLLCVLIKKRLPLALSILLLTAAFWVFIHLVLYMNMQTAVTMWEEIP